jgi:hypothetical protein
MFDQKFNLHWVVASDIAQANLVVVTESQRTKIPFKLYLTVVSYAGIVIQIFS